jgi:predicted MFS family arabinose efflux permease
LERVVSLSGEFRTEFQRGWPVLLLSVIAAGSGVGALATYSLSLFSASFQTDLGWSRSDIGFAISAWGVGSALAAPFAGRLADRFSVHRIAVVSTIGMAAIFASFASLTGSVQRLYIGFFVVAVLGSGTTFVCYSKIIALWFRNNRGLAFGIMATGGGLASVVLPPLINVAIDRVGWRGAWVALAAWCLIMAVPIWTLMRAPADSQAETVAQERQTGFKLGEAVTFPQFWLLVGASACFGLSLTGLISQLLPVLGDAGLSRGQAVAAASFLGVGAIVGRLCTGFLVDRLNPPLVACGAFLLSALGCLLLTAVPSAAPAETLLIGLALGAEADLLAFFAARYFGTRFMASIVGSLYLVTSATGIFGPLIIGAAYNRFHGYREVLIFDGIALLAAGALQALLGEPPRN